MKPYNNPFVPNSYEALADLSFQRRKAFFTAMVSSITKLSALLMQLTSDKMHC